MALVIRLNATNNRNGNPRRVFVGFNDRGDLVGAWNEDYSGQGAIPEDWQRFYQGITLMTTPAEYRNLVKEGAKLNNRPHVYGWCVLRIATAASLEAGVARR